MFLNPEMSEIPLKRDDTEASAEVTETEPNAPFINEQFLDDLRSATSKATNDFAKNLTVENIDSSLANDAAMNGGRFTDGERDALKAVKDNFVDFERLDSGGMSGVSKADIELFGSLYKTTGRDIYFYDTARTFMTENKSKLDQDGDGVLSLKEIQNGKTNPNFTDRELQLIDYLSDRYSGKLRYSHYLNDISERNVDVPDGDYAEGGLNDVIDRNQTKLFEQRTRGWMDSLLTVGGIALGAYLSHRSNFGFLAGTGMMSAGAIAGIQISRPLSSVIASYAQDAQADRIHRLMTTVANLKY